MTANPLVYFVCVLVNIHVCENFLLVNVPVYVYVFAFCQCKGIWSGMFMHLRFHFATSDFPTAQDDMMHELGTH